MTHPACLSNEQISAWILGERPREVLNHVRGCEKCQAEVDGFGETLLGFRGAVRQWSEEQWNPNFQLAIKGRESQAWMKGLYWALAALVLCLCIGPFVRRGAQTNTAISDAALLKQIDQDVSRTVPGPMEPLTGLVSWETSGGE